MNSIQILSNRNLPIGKIINQELYHSNKTQIAVAFLKSSGIDVIDYSLKHSLDNGGKFEMIVGLDFKTTDHKAMLYFHNLKKNYPNVNFFCYGDKKENKNDIVFHPKIYLFENKREKTSIIGSANLTKGGLLSNFEVNTIFNETKPIYYSQLQAIYNSIKFTDSVFSPDEEYIYRYRDVFSSYSKNEVKLNNDKELKKSIQDMDRLSKELEGTIPSVKKIIIHCLEESLQKGIGNVSLSEITEFVLNFIISNGFETYFKMDTIKNTIRGELNYNEENGKDIKRNLKLFRRIEKGIYSLTKNGMNYSGR